MKLGAQVYSVRDYIQTPEDYRNTLKQLKMLGYDTVQHAGADITDPYLLRDLTQEADIRQVTPCLTSESILEDVDKAIQCVRILGCDSIMLPCLHCDTLATLDSFLAAWEPFEQPLRKMQEAGIHLCYHNHTFDIAPMFGRSDSFLDYLLENKPDWQFILDVAWAQYAKVDTLAWMEKLGSRINCLHFKDYTASINAINTPVFCSCGNGLVTLDLYAQKAKDLGVEHIIIEQDNAQYYPEPFQQMEQSAIYLRTLFE